MRCGLTSNRRLFCIRYITQVLKNCKKLNLKKEVPLNVASEFVGIIEGIILVGESLSNFNSDILLNGFVQIF
jgi:hypothetical protein